jgi:hypothetical protein
MQQYRVGSELYQVEMMLIFGGSAVSRCGDGHRVGTCRGGELKYANQCTMYEFMMYKCMKSTSSTNALRPYVQKDWLEIDLIIPRM